MSGESLAANDQVWVYTSDGGRRPVRCRALLLRVRAMGSAERLIGEVYIRAADMPKALRASLGPHVLRTDCFTTWEPLTSMEPVSAIDLLGELV